MVQVHPTQLARLCGASTPNWPDCVHYKEEYKILGLADKGKRTTEEKPSEETMDTEEAAPPVEEEEDAPLEVWTLKEFTE